MRILIALAIILGILAAADKANADDKRPCVSITEYHDTHDVSHYNRGATATPGHHPTRHQLERRWEVRHLGTIDHANTDNKVIAWEYPVCGYASIEDANVWVIEVRETHRIGVVMLWRSPHAVPNGSLY